MLRTKSIYADMATYLSSEINDFIADNDGKNNFSIISIQLGPVVHNGEGEDIETALITYTVNDPIPSSPSKGIFTCPYCHVPSAVVESARCPICGARL